MAIAAKKWKRVLSAKRGDPEIVGGNGFALASQLECNFSVILAGRLGDIQHEAVAQQTCEPVLIACPVPGLGDPIAIFAEHNHGDRHLVGARKNRNDGRVAIGRSGQGVGINDHGSGKITAEENHFHTSRSIRSNASSTRFSICLLSLRKGLRFPMCFIQGFSWDVTFQLLLDGLGHQLPKRNAALRGHRLGAAEQDVRDFEGSLHESHITIFMGCRSHVTPEGGPFKPAVGLSGEQ